MGLVLLGQAVKDDKRHNAVNCYGVQPINNEPKSCDYYNKTMCEQSVNCSTYASGLQHQNKAYEG